MRKENMQINLSLALDEAVVIINALARNKLSDYTYIEIHQLINKIESQLAKQASEKSSNG